MLFNNNIHVTVFWIFHDNSRLYTLYILDLHHILHVHVYLYCITWHVGLFSVHVWFIQLFKKYFYNILLENGWLFILVTMTTYFHSYIHVHVRKILWTNLMNFSLHNKAEYCHIHVHVYCMTVRVNQGCFLFWIKS